MTTERQILANRENAKKSTGPKSIEGKSRSKLNALTHGVLSLNEIIPDECRPEYEAFREGFIHTLQPKGILEIYLVEKLISCAWRQRRSLRAEIAVLHKQPSQPSLEIQLDETGRSLANLSRYESTLEKNFYRALQKLEELQKQREEDIFDF